MADLLADSFGLSSSKNLVLPHETVDEAVRRYVLSACSRALTQTRDWRVWLLEATKRYEAMRSTRSLDADDPGVPWHWASNVGVPMEASAGEQLKSRFNQATVDAEPKFRVLVLGDDNELKLLDEPLTKWYEDFLTRKVRIRRVRSDTWLNLMVDGDAIEGVEWAEEWRQTATTVVLFQDAQGNVLVDAQGQPRAFRNVNMPSEAIPKDATGQPMKKLLVEQKGHQLLYRGVRVRSWRIAETIWPATAIAPDPDDLDWFTLQAWKSPSWFKTREGDPLQGKLKNIAELLDRLKRGIPDSANVTSERGLTSGLDFPSVPGKTLLWTFFGQFDVDSDGIDEEIIAHVAPVQRLLLGWRLSPFARRPFFHFQLFRMPGRFTGRGLPHIGKGTRDMVDFYANAANNRNNLYLDPPLLYESESGFDPDLHQFGTGALWGPLNAGAIANKRIALLEMPHTQELLADRIIAFYSDVFDRLSAVSKLQMGGAGKSLIPSTKTKGGTLAILGESQPRFSDWIMEYQELAEEEIEFIDRLIGEMADAEALTLMSPVTYKNAAMPVAVFKLPKQFHATGNSQTMNRQAMQQILFQLLEISLNDPVLNLLPETQVEIRKRVLDLYDVDLPLPTIEQVKTGQMEKLKAALMQLPPEKLAEVAQHVQSDGSRPAGAPHNGGLDGAEPQVRR